MSEHDPGVVAVERSRPVPHLERERGTVEVWALGDDRFVVLGPDREREVDGFEEARKEAHELARRLD